MENEQYGIENINWIDETIMSKKDLIYKKHGLSNVWLFGNRILFATFIFLFLYILPNIAYIIWKVYQFPDHFIIEYYILACIFLALVLTIKIIIFTKISFKFQCGVNIFVIISFLFLFLLYVIWEIGFIADKNLNKI